MLSVNVLLRGYFTIDVCVEFLLPSPTTLANLGSTHLKLLILASFVDYTAAFYPWALHT